MPSDHPNPPYPHTTPASPKAPNTVDHGHCLRLERVDDDLTSSTILPSSFSERDRVSSDEFLRKTTNAPSRQRDRRPDASAAPSLERLRRKFRARCKQDDQGHLGVLPPNLMHSHTAPIAIPRRQASPSPPLTGRPSRDLPRNSYFERTLVDAPVEERADAGDDFSLPDNIRRTEPSPKIGGPKESRRSEEKTAAFFAPVSPSIAKRQIREQQNSTPQAKRNVWPSRASSPAPCLQEEVDVTQRESRIGDRPRPSGKLPKFHPLNFPRTKHNIPLASPLRPSVESHASHQNKQPPLSTVSPSSRKRLQEYQRQIIASTTQVATAASATQYSSKGQLFHNSIATASDAGKPPSLKLAPLSSPGDGVTPLQLEEQIDYILAGAGIGTSQALSPSSPLFSPGNKRPRKRMGQDHGKPLQHDYFAHKLPLSSPAVSPAGGPG